MIKIGLSCLWLFFLLSHPLASAQSKSELNFYSIPHSTINSLTKRLIELDDSIPTQFDTIHLYTLKTSISNDINLLLNPKAILDLPKDSLKRAFLDETEAQYFQYEREKFSIDSLLKMRVLDKETRIDCGKFKLLISNDHSRIFYGSCDYLLIQIEIVKDRGVQIVQAPRKKLDLIMNQLVKEHQFPQVDKNYNFESWRLYFEKCQYSSLKKDEQIYILDSLIYNSTEFQTILFDCKALSTSNPSVDWLNDLMNNQFADLNRVFHMSQILPMNTLQSYCSLRMTKNLSYYGNSAQEFYTEYKYLTLLSDRGVMLASIRLIGIKKDLVYAGRFTAPEKSKNIERNWVNLPIDSLNRSIPLLYFERYFFCLQTSCDNRFRKIKHLQKSKTIFYKAKEFSKLKDLAWYDQYWLENFHLNPKVK